MALDNFLNHPNYGMPNANITSTAAGVISSLRATITHRGGRVSSLPVWSSYLVMVWDNMTAIADRQKDTTTALAANSGFVDRPGREGC